jgi:hypothetical protein
MTKFKLGDQVKLIANTSGSDNEAGDVGIITEVDESVPDYRVQVEGGPDCANWSKEEDLELA